MATRQIIFDGRALAQGLSHTFTRNVSTVDDLGVGVAANTPRYGRPVATGTQRVSSEYAIQNATSNVSSGVVGKSASGLDADGVSPLAMMTGADLTLRFFAGTLATAAASVTAASLVRTVRSGVNKDDLAKFCPDRDDSVYHEYTGVAGAQFNVIPGAILAVANQRLSADDDVTGNFTIIEISKPDGGQWGDAVGGWRIVGTFDGHASGAGVTGGNRWSWHTYFPESLPGDHTPPMTIWLVGTDYKASPPGGAGVTFIFKATRAAVGEPWTYGQIKRIENGECTHAHSAGLVFRRNPDGSINRIEVITVLGDTGGGFMNSYMTRHWCDDPDNYDTADWSAQLDFCGKHGTTNAAIFGEQPASLCVGPDDRSLLTASDLDDYSLLRLDVPEDTAAKAVWTRLWGYGGNSGWDGLYVTTNDPVRRGPYVHQATRTGIAAVGRTVYSATGEAGSWLALTGTAADGLLWGSQLLRLSTNALTTVDPGAVIPRRPMRLGPGGTNALLSDNPGVGQDGAFDSNGVGIAGTWAGGWTYPSDFDAIDVPAPPTKSRPLHVRMTGRSGAGITGGTQLCGTINNSGGKMMSRWHHLPKPGHSGRWLMQQGNPGGLESPPTFRGQAHNEWWPCVCYATPPGNASTTYFYVIAENSQPYGQFNQLIVPDVIYIDRAEWPGYSVAPGASGQNERLSVNGYACGEQWTHYVLMQVPADSWVGGATEVGDGAQSEIPLFTVFGDTDNHCYAYVDLANDAIEVEVTSDGSTLGTASVSFGNVELIRHAQLRIGIAQTATDVEVTVTIDGALVATDSVEGVLLVQPSEVRFGKPSFSASTLSDAANVDVFSVTVVDNEAQDATRRASQLNGSGLLRLTAGNASPVLSDAFGFGFGF